MKKVIYALLFGGVFGFLTLEYGLCQDMSNMEISKELETLEKKIETLEKESSKGKTGGWMDKVSVSGGIELDYFYESDSADQSSSDLDVGTVELGVELALHDYVTGNMILKGESLDGDDRVFWDEATIAIQKEDVPAYFVGGRRGQPFGVFENHLISDPITKEVYEICETGATLGYLREKYKLDMSGTIYQKTGTNDVSSYIINITSEPMDAMTVAVFFNSAPDNGGRDETIGGMFQYEMNKLTFDVEYFQAMNREGDNKESAGSGAVVYELSDPLEVAFRYEVYDDDISGDQDETLKNRYSLGFSYTLFEKDPFSTSFLGEYRKTKYETSADGSLNEYLLRLAVAF